MTSPDTGFAGTCGRFFGFGNVGGGSRLPPFPFAAAECVGVSGPSGMVCRWGEWWLEELGGDISTTVLLDFGVEHITGAGWTFACNVRSMLNVLDPIQILQVNTQGSSVPSCQHIGSDSSWMVYGIS